jgi:hypothetical protein
MARGSMVNEIPSLIYSPMYHIISVLHAHDIRLASGATPDKRPRAAFSTPAPLISPAHFWSERKWPREIRPDYQ